MKKIISLQLDQDIIEKLQQLAKNDSTSLSSIIRRIIINYFKGMTNE